MLNVKKRKRREIEKVYRTGNALFLEQESGTIRIVPQAADIIRISYTENGIFPAKQGEAYGNLSGTGTWEYTEEGQDICILTDSFVVKVDRMSGSIRYEGRMGSCYCARLHRRVRRWRNSIRTGRLQAESAKDCSINKYPVREGHMFLSMYFFSHK